MIIVCNEWYIDVLGYVETPEVTETVTRSYSQQTSGEYYD